LKYIFIFFFIGNELILLQQLAVVVVAPSAEVPPTSQNPAETCSPSKIFNISNDVKMNETPSKKLHQDNKPIEIKVE